MSNNRYSEALQVPTSGVENRSAYLERDQGNYTDVDLIDIFIDIICLNFSYRYFVDIDILKEKLRYFIDI